MAEQVVVTKTEYRRLKSIAQRYEAIRRLFEADFFAEPPTKDVTKIVREFRKTGLYTDAFLKSLARGLKESSFFRTR